MLPTEAFSSRVIHDSLFTGQRLRRPCTSHTISFQIHNLPANGSRFNPFLSVWKCKQMSNSWHSHGSPVSLFTGLVYLAFGCCLSLLSIAVINTITQSNLEEESIYFYGHSSSLKKVRSGIKPEPKQKPQRNTAYWLDP